MKKPMFALAALAAIGFAGAAFAEDATTGATTGPAAMSDADMDRVTAGVSPGDLVGLGQTTADVNRPDWAGPHSPPAGKGYGTENPTGFESAPGRNPPGQQ
jgi:hypothetical protein